MQFDVAGAIKAGATPDQIAQFLAEKQGFDLDGALGAGASVDQVIGFLAKPIETKEAGIVDRLKDTGIDVAKGFVGAGEALVGVGNLVSGNLVGDGLTKIGYDPKRTKEILSSGYSEERQAENAAVRDAEGFVGTARSLLENPAVAVGSMVESAPMMLGSAGAVRAVAGGMLARAGIAPGTAAAAEFLKRPEVLAKLATVGSAAEGATTAGSIQEQARQEGSGYADSAGYALAGGAGTALIGKAASKLLPDADVIAGTLGMGGRNSGAGFLGAAKGIGKGMVQEGVLEEMPQSAQEQAFTNLATSKPWSEGVAESAAQGLIVGAAMGGGVNLVDATSRRRAVAEQALQQATDAASAAAAANEMASVDLNAAVNEVEQAVSAYLRPDGGIPTPDQAMAQPTIETPQPLTPQEKQELARQQLQSTPVADPLAELRLQVNPATTMADVAQRRDAVEASAIERMLAEDMAARPVAQELAPPVATPAPDLAQASAQEQAIPQPAEAEKPPANLPRPSRILGQPTSSYTDDQLTRMIDQPDIPAVSRRGASIELSARQAAQPQAAQRAATLTNEGTMPQAAPLLEQPQVQPAPVLEQPAPVQIAEWQDREAAPAGTWVKADFKLADSQPVYQVRELNVNDLYLPELTRDGKLQPEKRKYVDGYAERLRNGEMAPSINVIEMEDGRMRVVDGHRRVMAAREAGNGTIRALVSPLIDTPSGKQEATSELLQSMPSNIEQNQPPAQQTPAVLAAETVAPTAPIQLGRDQTPLAEGGKPFKTRAQAAEAKKLQPMMRVVSVKGGYALAEKTAAQIAAQEKAAQRLRQARTSPKGEPIPAHAFVAANGGMQYTTKSDMGVDGNPRIGNRSLFAAAGRGLSIERATEMLVAEGYLSQGASHNDSYAIIKKSLTQPQYNADGIERIAEMESAAQFEDYLAAQEEMERDPWEDAPAAVLDEYTADELEASGYDAAPDAIKAEVQALLEMADARGIDGETILLQAHEQTRNATERDYYEAAKSALQEAIQGSPGDRSAPAGRQGEEGTSEDLTAPTREDVLASQDRASNERALQTREQIRRESEAGAGLFELTREDGRQDTTGALFSRSRGRNPQEETPEFKRWFGDSKVVDADGNPLVVYHGTEADFSVFDPEKIGSANTQTKRGSGFYFAKDPALTSRYANREGANVIPAYVRITNPAPDIDSLSSDEYDGFINSRIVVVKSSTQVKSATGNNGDFDPANPDIRRSTPRGSKLATPSDGRIVNTDATTTGKAPVPGSKHTVQDGDTSHSFTVVDTSKLGTQGRLIQQIARIFGKRVVAFQSDTLQADGFVMNGDQTSIYLNVESTVSPMAVFGHELTHQMKKDNPQAYAALEAVVQRNMGEEGMTQFRQEYGEDADIEELSSDLVGNRFREPAFWEDVFNEIAAQNPTGAAAIVQRVGQAIRKAVDTLLKTIRQQGFNADAYVTNLEEIRDAVRVAMVDYAKQQREPAMAGVSDTPAGGDGMAKFSEARDARSAEDFKTGEPVRFQYLRNTAGVRQFGAPGEYGTDIEPVGRYMLFNEAGTQPQSNDRVQWESGRIRFESPMVVDADNWKEKLSARFGGLTGSALSDAVRAAGFDAIVTRDKYGIGEIVDLGKHKATAGVKNAPVPANAPEGEAKPSTVKTSRRRNIFGQQVLPTWTAPTETKLDDFLYVMQDKMVDTKRVVEAVKGAIGRIDDQWNPYLQEELYHGRTATKTKQFLGDELRPLLQDMQSRGVGMADFEEYLHNRHAEERNQQIAKVNPEMPDGGSGIDTADARAYLAGLDPAKRRAYEALARRIDAITAGTRQLLVDNGLETQDTIDAWDAAYSQYVPLNREDLDFSSSFTSTGTGQGFSVKGAASKRATGSKRKVVDILANIAMQRERAIVRSEKNRVATAVYGLAASQPNTDFWLAVNPDAIKDPIGLRNELVKMGLNPLDAQNLIEEPTQTYIDPRTGLVSQRINPALRSSPNVLAVRVDGKDRYVFFNASDERSQRMVKALKNLDADQLGWAMNIMGSATRWFASVNTQYNPMFGAFNFLRDSGGAALQLTNTPIAGMTAEVMSGVIPALRGIYADLRAERKGNSKPNGAWATLWEEFQKEGAQTGYRDQFSKSAERAKALESELKRITEGKAKQFGRAMFDWLSDYNETMENAVRLAAYKTAKDKGLSNQQAASVAKNLTVNFNRKGQVAAQAGVLYAFFNSAIQGSTRLVETLSHGRDKNASSYNPSRWIGPAGKAIIGGGLLLGVIQAVMLAAAGYDDDEPPEFVRERSFIIPLPDGKYLTIPMPLGYNVIPNTSRVMTEFVLSGFRDPAKRVAQITGALLDTFNPIGNAGWSMQTLVPTVFDPLAALAENRDWTGKQIAKKDRSDTNPTPGYTRAKETASWFSKELSYYLNLASGGTKYKPGFLSPTPDQIDYLIGQVTGGVGREALKIEQTITSTVTGEELPPYKIPLAGRFYGDTKSASAESNRFYENITRLNEHENEIKGRRENRENPGEYLRENPEARLYQFANKIEQDVTKLRKRRRELLERGASKESLKMIETQITNRMKRLNDRVKAVQDAED